MSNELLAGLPTFIREALESRGLFDAYLARSPAQQAHYVRRILRAGRAATVQKRLDQLLDELEGGLYMGREQVQGLARKRGHAPLEAATSLPDDLAES